MQPWIIVRRGWSTRQRDPWRPHQPEVARKKRNIISVLNVGEAALRLRETWEGSREPPVPSI